jgi:hypothetical protein
MLLILGLALLAGFNPKLLIVDLILAGNKRPLLMFTCFLLGGIGLGLTVGLLSTRRSRGSRTGSPAMHGRSPPALP